MNITIELRADDGEPILREAAYEAAKYGALCDHITRKTYDAPTGWGQSLDDARKVWQARFLRAKRIVEAFGVEVDPTSEAETLTVHHPYVGGKKVPRNVAGMRMVEIVGSKPDYDHPQPCYRREVHSQACHAAASRVIRAWRSRLSEQERCAA